MRPSWPGILTAIAVPLMLAACISPRGTGDLGLVVERELGRVQVIEHSNNTSLSVIPGLGDLSHASIVYSRDGRFGYVFGRDGGLTKVDLLRRRVTKRIVQAGNSIGGAISQDGALVAVSNYTPGGVKVFDSRTLEQVADIPAIGADGNPSKVVGLVDAPGNRFVFSLYDAGEIWIADMSKPDGPTISRFTKIGRQPYDALITPDGRYYIAGLFGEDGLALLDLWHPDRGVKRILSGYGRGEEQLPVYKMPHLEGWALAGNLAFVPAVGRHEVLVIDAQDWTEIARIPVHGQPIFVMAQPDGRKVWTNFAMPANDTLQVIDTESLDVERTIKPGPAALHMEFTPRGERIWISVRDQDVVRVLDTSTYQEVAQLEAHKPSGIFFGARAHRTGL